MYVCVSDCCSTMTIRVMVRRDCNALYSFSPELSHPQVDINGIISLLSGFFNPFPYYLQDCMK